MQVTWLFGLIACWLLAGSTYAMQQTNSTESAHASKQQLTLYSYHQVPPFVIKAQQKTGLNYALLESLQQELGDNWHLTLQYLSRPELNARLAAGLPTIVLWANPAWFKPAQGSYLWSPVLFSDREVFVSYFHGGRAIGQLTDLQGLRVGAVRGYKYPGLDQLFASGQVRRVDADSDQDNLAALLDQQIDQLVITRSSFLFFGRQPQFFGKLAITGQPYPAYTRQILLTAHYQAQFETLSAAVAKLQQQPQWQTRLDLFGLKSR